MTTNAKKISLYNESRELVNREIYCAADSMVNYIIHQPEFYDGGGKIPFTYDEIEHGPRKYESEEEEEEDCFDFMEAYFVSDWLADELYNRGEWVYRSQYDPCIWFRNCTGQATYCDDVIQDIARDRLVRIGELTQEEAAALNFCD